MHTLKWGMAVVLVCVLTATFPSCSYIQKITGRESTAVDAVVTQAQAHIAAGDYKRALDAYSDACEKYPRNRKLQDSYARAGDQVRIAADASFQKKDYSEAGGIYLVLLKSGIIGRDFSGSMSFDAGYVNRQIKACAEALLERGLMRYRDGNLENAISIWKKALAFDPDNKDIKSAIDTTTIQLQNLKNIR